MVEEGGEGGYGEGEEGEAFGAVEGLVEVEGLGGRGGGHFFFGWVGEREGVWGEGRGVWREREQRGWMECGLRMSISVEDWPFNSSEVCWGEARGISRVWRTSRGVWLGGSKETVDVNARSQVQNGERGRRSRCFKCSNNRVSSHAKIWDAAVNVIQNTSRYESTGV